MISAKFLTFAAEKLSFRVFWIPCILWFLGAFVGSAQAQVATPTITPLGEQVYPVTQGVVVNCSTSGATIYYTTNGVDPTQSDRVVAAGGTLTVNRLMTLKAKAFHPVLGASAVASSEFPIFGQIASGKQHSIALATDGTVWVWGDNSSYQLGATTPTTSNTPLKVAGLTGILAVAAGDSHNVVLKMNNASGKMEAWAWGSNSNGQLGNNSIISSATPVQVGTLSGVTEIAAGSNFTLLLIPASETNAGVWACGDNTNGRLGNGNTTQSLVPVQSLITGATAIAAGNNHAMAIIAPNGEVKAWGANGNGQLGKNATSTSEPTPVYVVDVAGTGHLTGVTQIEAGKGFSVALVGTTPYAWGDNASGQLGDGTTAQKLKPTNNVPNAIGSPAEEVTAVAAGDLHALVVTKTHKVYGWGRNDNGQLGRGNTTNPGTTPQQISTLGTGVAAASGGVKHSLFIKTDGTVYACGDNSKGQLGDASTTQRTSPVQVKGPAGSLYGGWLNVIDAYLDYDGDTLLGWQEVDLGTDPNKADTDGDGTTDQSDAYPTDFYNGQMPTVLKVSGDNQQGAGTSFLAQPLVVQVKNSGGTALVNAPVTFSGNFGATFSATLNGTATSTMVVRTDASGLATAYGRLPLVPNGPYTITAKAVTAVGDVPVYFTATDKVSAPVLSPAGGIFGLKQVVTITSPAPGATMHYTTNGSNPTTSDPIIASGGTITLRQSTVIKAKAWYGSYTPSDVVTGDFKIVGQMDGGNAVSILLRSNGELWDWGGNMSGRLGDNTTTNRVSPIPVTALPPVRILSVVNCDSHCAAVLEDGTLWTWGGGSDGQLGVVTTGNIKLPVRVPGLAGVKAAAVGVSWTLALDFKGTVWAFGKNGKGQLGPNGTIGTSSVNPLQVMTGVKAIAAGESYGLAIKTDNTVWAWGDNGSGQLGNGSTGGSVATPAQVTVLSDITAIAAGTKHALALKSDKTVWAWGAGADGQLGGGTTPGTVSTPAKITAITDDIMAVAAGEGHSVALTTAGRVITWGRNSSGQLGNGGITGSSTPATLPLTAIENVVYIGAGHNHTLALKDDLTVWTWGLNDFGQIGDGTITNHSSPTLISGPWIDSDGDGLTDYQEGVFGTNPALADTNGNGLSDSEDLARGISPTNLDLDGDGVSNATEIANGTNPYLADSDGDGVNDASDAFPLDPTRTINPASDPNDHTAPTITITKPLGASLVP